MPDLVGYAAQTLLSAFPEEAAKAIPHPLVMADATTTSATTEDEDEIEPYRRFEGMEEDFLGIPLGGIMRFGRLPSMILNGVVFGLSLFNLVWNYMFTNKKSINDHPFLSVTFFPLVATYVKFLGSYLEESVYLIDEPGLAEWVLFSSGIGLQFVVTIVGYSLTFIIAYEVLNLMITSIENSATANVDYVQYLGGTDDLVQYLGIVATAAVMFVQLIVEVNQLVMTGILIFGENADEGEDEVVYDDSLEDQSEETTPE